MLPSQMGGLQIQPTTHSRGKEVKVTMPRDFGIWIITFPQIEPTQCVGKGQEYHVDFERSVNDEMVG